MLGRSIKTLYWLVAFTMAFLSSCGTTQEDQTISPTSLISPTETAIPTLVSASTAQPTQTATPTLPTFVPNSNEYGSISRTPPTIEQVVVRRNEPSKPVPPAIKPYKAVAEDYFGNVEFTSNNDATEDGYRWNTISRSDDGNILWAQKIIDGKVAFEKFPTPFLVHPENGTLLGIDTSYVFREIPGSQNASIVYTGDNSELPTPVKGKITLANDTKVYSAYFEFNNVDGVGEWKFAPALDKAGFMQQEGAVVTLDQWGNIVDTGKVVPEEHTLEAVNAKAAIVGADGVATEFHLEGEWLAVGRRVRDKEQNIDRVLNAQGMWEEIPNLDIEAIHFEEGKLTDVSILGGEGEINPAMKEELFNEFWGSWGQSELYKDYIQAIFGHFPVTLEEIQAQESLPVVINLGQNNEMWFPVYTMRIIGGTWIEQTGIDRWLNEMNQEEQERYIASGINPHHLGFIMFNGNELSENRKNLMEEMSNLVGDPKHFGDGYLSYGFNSTKKGDLVVIVGTWMPNPPDTDVAEYILLRDRSVGEDLVAGMFAYHSVSSILRKADYDDWICNKPGKTATGCGPVEKYLAYTFRDFEESYGDNSYQKPSEHWDSLPFRPAN